MSKKPIFFLIFKLIGFLCIATGILGVYILSSGVGDHTMFGAFALTFGFSFGLVFLLKGFTPERSKMRTKTLRYILEQNKIDLSAVATTEADIASDAIAKTVLEVDNKLTAAKKYCKHCGAKIDTDSRFCNQCGKKQ